MERQRDGIRNVGHGGMVRVGRRRVAGFAAAGSGFGMQLFRYRVGLRRRAQRGAAGENSEEERGQKALRGYESAAEEPALAGAERIQAGRSEERRVGKEGRTTPTQCR